MTIYNIAAMQSKSRYIVVKVEDKIITAISKDDVSKAAEAIQRAISALGPGLGGYSLVDLLGDQFPDWKMVDIHYILVILFNTNMVGYTVIKTTI